MSDNNLVPMVKVMKDLRKDGYNVDFVMENKKFINSSSGRDYQPGDITIENEYRFEGDSNPDDTSILYAIKTKDGEKGLAVNGYGVSADADMDGFLMNSGKTNSK